MGSARGYTDTDEGEPDYRKGQNRGITRLRTVFPAKPLHSPTVPYSRAR